MGEKVRVIEMINVIYDMETQDPDDLFALAFLASHLPEECRLDKFKGKITCATFNLNGDPKSGLLAIGSDQIKEKRFVSKNVCHGMIYDHEMHEQVYPFRDKNAGLRLIYDGMDNYLKKRSEGKKFHNPLACAVAVNPDICEFREVELYREKGQWGSRLADGTNTFISISANKEKFIQTLVGENDVQTN